MKYKSLLFGLLPAFLIFNACKKSTEPIIIENGHPDFPLQIGNEWIYAVHDSVRLSDDSLIVSTDTLVVTITGDTVLDNGRAATTWHYQFRDKEYNSFAALSNDTLWFYGYPSGYLETFFLLPLKVGKGWKIFSDSVVVLSKESILTPMGNFNNVYHLRQSVFQPNAPGYIDYWISSEYGIVKRFVRIIYTIGMTIESSQWELISAKL